MQWIQYLLFAIILLLVLQRLLPVRGVQNLTSTELAELLKNSKNYSFIDVREPQEYKRGYIKGFRNIPLSQLQKRHVEIDTDKMVVLTCQSGMRSKRAAQLLKKQGVQNIAHLKTGVSGWRNGLIK